MTPEQWKRIEELFEAAADLDRDEQSSFLEGACGDQPALRAEIESLLATNQRAGRFLETPAVAVGQIGIRYD